MKCSTRQSQRTLVCGDLALELGKRTLIMGILNVTPDSFSDGGQYFNLRDAVERAIAMVAEGADMIDVGGESTRPGATELPLSLELQRVIPVIKELRKVIHIPISIDTYKAEVARQALDAGAHIINDIWGLRADPEMASVAARYACPVILMHNRSHRVYTDFLAEVIEDLQQSIEIARAHGVDGQQILLDPGIGFGKDTQQSLVMMNALDRIAAMGYPIVLGTSRKSMIRNTLGGLPANDVIEGTIATNVLGIAQGCQIVRVHDVKSMKRAAVITDAILYSDQ